MRCYRQLTGKTITIGDSDPLGKGGEAQVFGIASEPGLAAKIYAEGKATEERAQKLALMLANPPDIPVGARGHVPIAWPVDLLHDPREPFGVVGFLMPRAYGVSEVINYYNPRSRLQNSPFFDYRYLLRTARNFAAGVRALHARDYVIGDVKHSNILVSQTALVTLVDTDSFQIKDPHSGRVFACPVQTPDFTPPELQGIAPGHQLLLPEHDRFGLGVMIFHLLMEGAHPFSGVYLGDGDPPPFEERIAAGHFPFGHNTGPYRPGVRVAPRFDMLAPSVQELFLKCFEEGHTDPSARPDAHMWQQTLDAAMRGLMVCPLNAHHYYGDHLALCPWCRRKRTQLNGSDPFPASISNTPQLDLTLPPPTKVGGYLADVPDFLAHPVQKPVVTGFNSFQSARKVMFFIGVPLILLLIYWMGMPNSVPMTTYQGPADNAWSGQSGVNTLPPMYPWPNGAVPAPVTPPETPSTISVTAMAFSPDSKWVATGGQLLSIQSLNGAAGWSRRFESNVVAVGFSRHSERLAVGTQGGSVYVMSVHGKGAFRPLKLPNAVRSVAFSPADDSLAVASHDAYSAITLLDAHTLVPQNHLDIGQNKALFAGYSPESNLLAAVTYNEASGNSEIILWNTVTGNRSETFYADGPAACYAFSRDASVLAIGSRDITLWQGKSNRITTTIPEDVRGGSVHSISFSPDGMELAYTVGPPLHERAFVLETRTGHVIERFSLAVSGGSTIAFSPNGKYLATVDGSEIADLYDAATGAFLRSLGQRPSRPNAAPSGGFE